LWLQVDGKPLQGDGFEQLFQRAAATGKGDDSIASGEHKVLALAHVFNKFEIGKLAMALLQLPHKSRHNAIDSPAIGQRAVCKLPHQTKRTSTVNDLDRIASQDLSQA
jgi:hypothetical protein